MVAKLLKVMAILAFMSVGVASQAAPGRAAVAYRFVTSLNPEQHSGAYFKKAHQAIVAGSPKVSANVVPPSRWETLTSFFLGLLSAFLAGILLMFTPYGVLAFTFALGVLYNHRNRDFKTLIKNGLVFVGSFIPVYALSHVFLPHIDEILENSQIHFWFSLAFIVCVAVAALSLLGILQLRAPRPVFQVEQRGLVDGLVIAFCGGISALMLLTQKASVLFMMARQLDVGALAGGGFVLSFAVAAGVGFVLFMSWLVASYFMKQEYLDLWAVDLLSVLAWFSFYKSILVMRPYMFSWHYNLLLAILACCAGVYYWMSVRMEITYQYIDAYSKAARVDTLLHIFGGMRFFNGRILFKRFIAVVAFAAMGSFMVKTYLFYQGITMKQAIIQGLKSL